MVSGDQHLLDHRGVLASVAESVRVRRQASVDELDLVLAWADLHAVDPQSQPGAVPPSQGGERFLALGGDGAPQASEFCWAELAVARETGIIATRNLAADALDLRHRLPRTFAQVRALRLEVWVARRIAAMTRPLPKVGAALVDAAVVDATQLPAGQLLALAEAKVIEADLEAHRRRIALDEQATGVWRSRPRTGDRLGGEAGSGEAATGRIAAKLPLEDLLELDSTIDDVAAALASHISSDEDAPTTDQLRAQALALLAHPASVLALLRGPSATDGSEDVAPPARPRRHAVLYLHLTPGTLLGGAGVVRCEELGPLLVEQATRLLGHRNVTLRPVIDLNAVQTANGYEHPTTMRERALLRTTAGDAFPYSSAGRAIDHDHVVPYDPGGPPGQTNDRNHAPLTRTHHRLKTHARGWQVEQLGLGAYRWTTPHGLCRVVTPFGTRAVDPIHDDAGRVVGEIYWE